MDMNKWFYRAVGTVGVASGFLMLAGGVAQADEADVAQPAVDPQQLRGLLADLFTPTAGTLPAAPLPADRAVDGVRAAAPTDTPLDLAGNDVLVQGPLPDVLRNTPLHALPTTTPLPSAPATTENLPAVPVVGGLLAGPLAGLPNPAGLAGVPGAGALPKADGLSAPDVLPGPDGPTGPDGLPAPDVLPGSDGLPGPVGLPRPEAGAPTADPQAQPVDGVGPVRNQGLLDTLPLHSSDTNLPVRSDHLNADPAIGMLPPGLLPPGLRPRIQTGSVGTELPVAGPVRVDSATGKARVPALIGDTMAAQRADLFGTTHPSEAQMPLLGSLPVVGRVVGGAPAGLPALPGALPLAGGLPIGGGLPGAGPVTAPGTGHVGTPVTDDVAGAAPALPGRHAAQSGHDGRHAAAQTARPGRHAAGRPGRHAAPDDSGTGAAGRRIIGSPTGRAAERPVAGEDADFV
jgi:hypothetical protein